MRGEEKTEYGFKRKVLDFLVCAAEDNGLDSVILYGSRAQGTYREKSDIDLAISGGNKSEFMYAMDEQCPTLLMFDFFDLDKSEGSEMRERILAEGVCLYGKRGY